MVVAFKYEPLRYYDDSSLLVEVQPDSMDRPPGTDPHVRSPEPGAARLLPPGEPELASFSIGICASGDSADTLRRLIGVIQSEAFPAQFALSRVIIVASDPSESTAAFLLKLADDDRRVMLIHEPKRKGKVDAVNTIIRNRVGSYLVFVNADAIPEAGAITKLILRLSSDPGAGAISACPTFSPSGDLNSRLLEFMWATHNVSSLELNHLGMSNHASAELMVVRSEAVVTLPNDVVNDGAYISGRASARGYRILFCGDAKVTIDVPGSVVQLIEQRRRILFGHRQVWKKLGRRPLTVESLILVNPALSLSLVGRVIASRPSRILVVPVAVMAEVAATVLSIADRFTSKDRHTVWKRYRA
jgi:cellulose synthase/poly-beta-1,6-N-acetylglucosamine synthase-like glycosyltransferase